MQMKDRITTYVMNKDEVVLVQGEIVAPYDSGESYRVYFGKLGETTVRAKDMLPGINGHELGIIN